MKLYRPMTKQERTAWINKIQRKHPGTRRQRSWNGIEHSVQFFDKTTGNLIADYDIPAIEYTPAEYQAEEQHVNKFKSEVSK